jgi:peptide/nickel transport system substrate-binding protein
MKQSSNKLIKVLILAFICVTINGLMLASLQNKAVNFSKFLTYPPLNTSNGVSIFKVGTTSSPATIEPVDTWDGGSNDVLTQVVETLFRYNLSDTDTPRINFLAQSYWWQDTTHLQIQLQQGILFHDGMPFNASAAKWNFDRLLYLTNCTGTNSGTVARTRTLWLLPDGITPIIASVVTVGTWNITITLNSPYGPLLDLLCFINAGMLSPSSTPTTDFIDLSTGQVIGTGPYVYNYYTPGTEVKFTRWDNYWRVPAYFEEMVFILYSDVGLLSNDMLSHSIDYARSFSTSYIPTYEADPLISVKRFTQDTGKLSLVYYYLGFNNIAYNVTWRKAMSYAINYTYVLDDMLNTGAITIAERANSPISPGFSAGYNASVQAATYDLTTARALMQSMGFGIGFTTDIEWTNVADGSSPFLTTNYTYNDGNIFRENLYYEIANWYRLIGIKVEEHKVPYSGFLSYLYGTPEFLGLYALGWAPDYLDPFNMLNPLFNPTSDTNSAQVNDPWLNAQLAAVVSTLDDSARNNIYKNIQWYISEIGYLHAHLYHPHLYFVHLGDLEGVPYNAMNSFYAYPIHRDLPASFSLSSTAGDPDDDGDFNLMWIASMGSENYSVYGYSSYITEINGSLTVLASEITDLTLALGGYADGTYYFIITAQNEHGVTLSNCIEVVVYHPPPGSFTLSSNAGNPDPDGNFDLTWTGSAYVSNYSVYGYSDYITEINGSLTVLASEITDLTLVLSGYEDGTYYFIVTAQNDYGVTLSNCIIVSVLIPETLGIPGYNTLFIIAALGIAIALILKKNRS